MPVLLGRRLCHADSLLSFTQCKCEVSTAKGGSGFQLKLSHLSSADFQNQHTAESREEDEDDREVQLLVFIFRMNYLSKQS